MIWRILVGLLAVVIVVFGGFYAWAWNRPIPPASPTALSFDPGIVAKGAQLAAIGVCSACHTKPGGKPFAGGTAFETPFGTVYGTNITPDVATGIGAYSEAAFRRAMRHGIDRLGNHLYPVFPYADFAKASDGDIAALYAFLMTREPVRQENRPTELRPPFNARIFAAAWQLLFLNTSPYRSDPAKSAEWNRGAYLVNGLGHCGYCHTPLNALGAEKHSRRFAGGELEGWYAPALGPQSTAPVPWTTDQYYAYLRTGFASQHGFAAGLMQEVTGSLSAATDSDLRAMAAYLVSLGGERNATEDATKAKAALAFARQRETARPPVTTTGAAAGPARASGAAPSGAAIFAGACAGCHTPTGDLPISRPVSLALTAPVNAPNPTNLVRIVLSGIAPRPGARGPIMPAFAGMLTDAQIVALVSYTRSHFSRGPAWTDVAGTVARLRRASATETP